MITVTLTVSERALIDEALKARAGRHASIARAKPHNAGPHDRAAAAMLKLRDRLAKLAEATKGRTR